MFIIEEWAAGSDSGGLSFFIPLGKKWPAGGEKRPFSMKKKGFCFTTSLILSAFYLKYVKIYLALANRFERKKEAAKNSFWVV